MGSINELENLSQYRFPVVTLYHNDVPYKFIVDTGCSISVVDTDVLPFLSPSPTDLSSQSITVDGTIHESNLFSITLLDSEGNSYEVLVSDTDFGNAISQIKKDWNIDIVGLIGNRFLLDNNCVIDYNSQKFIINDLSGNKTK